MADTWTATGDCITALLGGPRVKLSNGNALIVGGFDHTGTPYTTCQLYDAVAKTWSTTGSLHHPTTNANCINLNDGTLLKAGGGVGGGFDGSVYCETYDPNTGSWTVTGDLNVPHWVATIFKLNDGRVLLAGGQGANLSDDIATSEIYDPNTRTWSLTGDLPEKARERFYCTLADGTPFVASGVQSATTTATFNGTTWVTKATCPFAGQSLENNACVILPTGDVLIICPIENSPSPNVANPNCFLYHPGSNTWSTISGPAVAHMGEVYLMRDGRVLNAGGETQADPATDTALCDIYNPFTNTWTSTTVLPLHAALAASGPELGGVVLNSGECLWVEQNSAPSGPFFSLTSLVFASVTNSSSKTSSMNLVF
jgi:hypothetical protein